jgi:hypothetical protein
MNASRQPLPRISGQIGPANTLARITARFAPAASMALGFFCFTPYPSIPIGASSALQIGNILSMILLVPALTLMWRHRAVHLYPLILAPLIVSAVKAALAGSNDLDLCLKSVSMIAITCLTLVITQLYAPRCGLQLITGIALATLLHAAVGLWQLYCFSLNEFPLAGLYVNQSFSSVQENSQVIAQYIQRPFGIFPEPSAMASSLAPWILFWFAELCGIVRLRDQPARWQRILFAAAAGGGFVLIVVSGSGHTVITAAGLACIGLLGFARLRATPKTFAIVLPALGVLVPLILWLIVSVMTARIAGEYQENGSWDERSASLADGFSLYSQGDPPTILFGIGAGLMPGALWNAAKLNAVFSVLLTYVYETGLAGAIAIALVGLHLLRVWRASGLNAAFAAVAVVWLVGIMVTTSYAQLLPIWVALGWLTVWPAVCAPADPLPARRRTVELGQWVASSEPRRQTWTMPQDAVAQEQT